LEVEQKNMLRARSPALKRKYNPVMQLPTAKGRLIMDISFALSTIQALHDDQMNSTKMIFQYFQLTCIFCSIKHRLMLQMEKQVS
jgi:hypothetical protein